jgi:hypothetical protein
VELTLVADFQGSPFRGEPSQLAWSPDNTTVCQKLGRHLGPADRIALLSIPSGPAVDFTTYHAPIRAALGRKEHGASKESRKARLFYANRIETPHKLRLPCAVET